MTQTEALKMALEALENHSGNYKLTKDECVKYRAVENAIKEALAQEKALQALHDENERLGLYKDAYAQPEQCKYGQEPKSCTSNPMDCQCALDAALAQPEQEPVAWLHTKIEGVAVPHRPADLDKYPDRWTALYKEPKPCPTCEALARTVMLDQTSHDTTPPQRKPLTDEEMKFLATAIGQAQQIIDTHNAEFVTARDDLRRCAELLAAHGIKGDA